MAMIIFINAPPSNGLTAQENTFKTWLMLEMLIIVTLVLINNFYLLKRSFKRDLITFNIDWPNVRPTTDYLEKEDT